MTASLAASPNFCALPLCTNMLPSVGGWKSLPGALSEAYAGRGQEHAVGEQLYVARAQ
jgi:hypothetical protein